MTIAVNLTHLISEVNRDFIDDHFERIAAGKPAHQFIFISTNRSALKKNLSPNIITVISAPRANTILLWKLWYDYTLPALLRKYKANVLINADGGASLRTKIPQCLFVNELYFTPAPIFFTKKQIGVLQKNRVAFLNKASLVITGSHDQKKQLAARYKIGEEKIEVLQTGVSELYQRMDFTEKEQVKEMYSEGKEYFLFSGEIHPRNNLVNLLKAFSFFKKRQKSNMQLLILARTIAEKEPFAESLKTYKYRNEVKLIVGMSESESSKIVAAAYAFVYPAPVEAFATTPLQAIQCGVPLILTDTPTLKETGGEAAMYIDAGNFQDIADKMMLIFKDENKRIELVKKANLLSEQYLNAQPDDIFWRSVTGL